MNYRIRNMWKAFIMAAMLFAAAPEAHALSLQDILNMAGLPEETLIAVVSSADELPAMTKDDYDALRRGSISVKVLAAIAHRRKVLDVQNRETDNSLSKKDISENNSIKDSISENNSIKDSISENNSIKDGISENNSIKDSISENNSIKDDISENNSIKDDIAAKDTAENNPIENPQALSGALSISEIGGVVPAPVQTSNLPIVFKKFFEEAYSTYTVESAVARRYAALKTSLDSARALDKEVPQVNAWRLQAETAPISSLESCMSLQTKLNPNPDFPIGAALSQCIGTALYRLGAPAMAAAYLDRALQSASAVQDFSETLRMFLDAAHASDYTSTSPILITKHADQIKESDRPDFLYFSGYSLVYGAQPDISAARDVLSSIPSGSIAYARARILLAVLNVRAPEYKFRTAAEDLNLALDTLDRLDTRMALELRSTAWLALARIAFENHVYETADAFYRKVDVSSHHLRDALLEDAWGQLLAGNYSQSLSLTHALHSPLFKDAWLPDLLLIEAGAYLGLCRYDMAQKSLERLKTTLLSDASQLKVYIAETPVRDYYNQIIQTAGGVSTSLPRSIYSRILSDNNFRRVHHSIRLLSEERQRLSRHSGGGFASWGHLSSVYDEAIAMRQSFIGTVISGIMESAQSELHALDISATQTAIEIRLAQRRREADCLRIAASGGHCASDTPAEQGVRISKSDSDAYWAFDGEFWRDEIFSYVSGVSSMCPAQPPSKQTSGDPSLEQ